MKRTVCLLMREKPSHTQKHEELSHINDIVFSIMPIKEKNEKNKTENDINPLFLCVFLFVILMLCFDLLACSTPKTVFNIKTYAPNLCDCCNSSLCTFSCIRSHHIVNERIWHMFWNVYIRFFGSCCLAHDDNSQFTKAIIRF